MELKPKIHQFLSEYKNKTVFSKQIRQYLKLDYTPENQKELGLIIKELEDEKYIRPVKSSLKNVEGIYEKYVILKQENYSNIKQEIATKLDNRIKIDYYLKHPDEYEKNKEIITKISEYLKENKNDDILTINERSYKIFKYEKELKNNEDIIKKLGLNLSDLNCYEVYEPFFYYENKKCISEDRRIIIIENKDTFWTIKQAVEQYCCNNVYLVIYGEGKKILKSFQFIKNLNIKENDKIEYFGDIDFEGINIYEHLKEQYSEYEISIYKTGYETILDSENCPQKIRTGQKYNEKYTKEFLQEFEEKYKKKLMKIIENKLYIPQEVFNFESIKNI